MKVRKAQVDDIPEIVNIHKERFSSFFLTSLGEGFLSTYYKSFLKFPGLLIVLEDQGDLKGFASGAPFNSGFYRQLLVRNFAGYAFIGIKLLFTRPLALIRIFTNMGASGQEKQVYAELLSIATVKNKKGYGSVLLNAFEAALKKEPYTADLLSLTTDFEDNEKAIAFYRVNGYKELNVFESYDNRKMYRFIKKL